MLEKTKAITEQPSRLTFVTSEMQIWTAFKQRSEPNIFSKLDDGSSFSPELYSVTKLLGMLWVTELASRTDKSAVVIKAINRGSCWV